MTDRPIDIPASRIPALLDGRMTQYRVPIEPEWLKLPDVSPVPLSEVDPPATMERLFTIGDRIRYPVYPPYAIGDRLWVREEWSHDAESLEECRAKHEDMLYGGMTYGPYYRATEVAPETLRWFPSTTMPRWASRITLTVTDLAVHRVQHITARQVAKEGGPLNPMICFDWFCDLYNTTHGPGAWERNDWVLARTFRVDLCNIDQMEEAT